jgi:hypothetical protein
LHFCNLFSLWLLVFLWRFSSITSKFQIMNWLGGFPAMHNSNNICIISFCGIFFPANKIASLNNFLHLCVNIFSHVVLLTFCVLSVHHSYHFATSLYSEIRWPSSRLLFSSKRVNYFLWFVPFLSYFNLAFLFSFLCYLFTS